jgi:hypothetical protein
MTDLTVANTLIRKNENGLYCLNDLHKASGGLQNKQPRYFLASKQSKELIAECQIDSEIPLSIINTGDKTLHGTYAVKEIVYAYAMWISPKFYHHVIKTYDAIVTGQLKMSQADEKMLRLTRINPNTLKAITGERSNNAVRENYKALIDAELIEEHTKIIFKRVYLPTAKGLDYVKASHHDIMRFKPQYHELIVEAVNEFKSQLSCDNLDLFFLEHSE